MKLKLFTLAAANAIVLMAVSFVMAQDMVPDPMAEDNGAAAPVYGNDGKGCKGMLDCCCCDQAGWIFGAEATFFRYHRADGVRWGTFDEPQFDYEISPRLTLGYVNCCGLGARVRYWEYDQSIFGDDDDFFSVDTYTLDFEIFQQVELDCCTTLEMSGGIRYNSFDEDIYNGFQDFFSENSFDGIGGIIGLEVTRDMCYVDAYARFRYSILTGDGSSFDDADGEVWFNDSLTSISEIALGISKSYCMNSGATLSAHVGVEWQQWQNYTSNFDTHVTLDDLDGHSDVGFFGFVIGAELVY